MKIVRDYLTSSEIEFIVNAMLEKDTAIEKEIVKVALVAQLVCEDIGDFEDCNDIYDKVVADSKLNFNAIINNYDIIDKLIAEETGINKIIKDFIGDISKKLEGAIKDLDLNSAIKQLKEIADKEEATTPAKGDKNGKTNKRV